MIESHYGALLVGYAVALGGWHLMHRWLPLWPAGSAPELVRPWRETAYAALSLVGVLLVGQMYVRGWLLEADGSLAPLLGAVNQVIIFGPFLAYLVIRRAPLDTVWLGAGRRPQRVLAGAVLALVAVLAYTVVRADAAGFPAVVAGIFRYGHLDEAVQVLLEDVVIAVLYVRLAAALGHGRAVVLVAVLFAAGHIPAMVAGGATVGDLASLVLDAGLGVAVIVTLYRSRDILWFWGIHFAMDMLQFSEVTQVG